MEQLTEEMMRKVSEYRMLAEDCRKRAAIAQDGDYKKALEHLAATWSLLGETRESQIAAGFIASVDEFASARQAGCG